MKTTLGILTLLFALSCHAQWPVASYETTWQDNGTNRPLVFSLTHDGYISAARAVADDLTVIESWQRAGGNWTLKTTFRTFFIENATESYKGTIREGVVTGTYKHFVTGRTFEFWFTPDGKAPGAIYNDRVKRAP